MDHARFLSTLSRIAIPALGTPLPIGKLDKLIRALVNNDRGESGCV